jgi:hypothetical protein
MLRKIAKITSKKGYEMALDKPVIFMIYFQYYKLTTKYYFHLWLYSH